MTITWPVSALKKNINIFTLLMDRVFYDNMAQIYRHPAMKMCYESNI